MRHILERVLIVGAVCAFGACGKPEPPAPAPVAAPVTATGAVGQSASAAAPAPVAAGGLPDGVDYYEKGSKPGAEHREKAAFIRQLLAEFERRPKG